MKTRLKITAAAISAAMICGTFLPSVSNAEETREVYVSNTDELIEALADVKAGDEIILKSGTYLNDEWLGEWSAFHAIASGTEDAHIIIRSENPDDPAVISGATQENKVALKIIGSYWEIRDLVICEAAKGIFLQQSEHSIISGCEVYNIGQEAIHIIDNSSYNLVENCFVHDAGTITPKYGEGVYIGSSKNTDGYGYECHYNTVRGCKFGPNIAADHVDIKEYTIGNIVEECTFDGTGMKGENGGDSFVEVKGNNCIIRNNTGYRNGCEKVLYAFDANVQLDGWGQNNRVYDNTLYMDTTDCYIFKEWNCLTYVFRNKAEPEGTTYSGGNKTVQVLDFELNGDVSEDGIIDTYDTRILQDHIVGKNSRYISYENSDADKNGSVNILDLCRVKSVMHAEEKETAKMSIAFNEEEAGNWRMCNGLGGRTVTFTLSAKAGNAANMGWGYWDPNAVNDNGTNGKWVQLSLGKHAFDENGEIVITVELPKDTTRTALQVYDYYDSSGNKIDKSEISLVKAITE